MKKISWLFASIFMVTMQSCTLNTETNYYSDSATSMQTNISMDRSMLSALNMFGDAEKLVKNHTIDQYENLSSDWKSIYDIQKDEKIVLNEKDAQALKKVFVKINREKGEFNGFSVKYDKLLPREIASIFASSRDLRKIPLQDISRWDGKKLEIDTEKFNSLEFLSELKQSEKETGIDIPKTKQDSIQQYGKQMTGAMIGMLKMVNMDLSSTFVFQKPIKSITGRHDLVRQIDSRTVKINVKTADLWDNGKTYKNKDKKITIITD